MRAKKRGKGRGFSKICCYCISFSFEERIISACLAFFSSFLQERTNILHTSQHESEIIEEEKQDISSRDIRTEPVEEGVGGWGLNFFQERKDLETCMNTE